MGRLLKLRQKIANVRVSRSGTTVSVTVVATDEASAREIEDALRQALRVLMR